MNGWLFVLLLILLLGYLVGLEVLDRYRDRKWWEEREEWMNEMDEED